MNSKKLQLTLYFLVMMFMAGFLFFMAAGLSEPFKDMVLWMNNKNIDKSTKDWAIFITLSLFVGILWSVSWLGFKAGEKLFLDLWLKNDSRSKSVSDSEKIAEDKKENFIEKKEKNFFVRGLIVALCILLAGMVIFRYFKVEPIGEINTGIIILLALLVVVVLSESFDSFSVGKLIAISREAKKKETQILKLERQNESLLAQIIAVSNSQSQRQSSTTVQGDYYATTPVVQKATDAEVEEKRDNENKAIAAAVNTTESDTRTPIKYSSGLLKEKALKNFLRVREFSRDKVTTPAKLSFLQGFDPISNIQPIFDCYVKEVGCEIFVDFRPERILSPLYRERLYLMLSKIHHYRLTKKVDAILELVVIKVPEEDNRRLWLTLENITEYFEPAISSGLLKISRIELSEAELAECQRP